MAQRRPRVWNTLFLEALADGLVDAAALLIHPTSSLYGPGAAAEDFDVNRKLRLLAARGLITLPGPTDARIAALTTDGRRFVRSGIDPETAWARPWDGQWRMVLFDVGEHERQVRRNLRTALQARRLGFLQGSVWISPDPLDELCDSMRRLAASPDALLFFCGRPFAGESDIAIVHGAWDFDRINAAYRDALRLAAKTPSVHAPHGRWRNWAIQVREAWEQASQLDPFLPQRLLPNDYLGAQALAAHRRAIRLYIDRLRARDRSSDRCDS